MKNNSSLLARIAVLSGLALGAFALSALATVGWNEAPADPPSNNTSAPINVGGLLQTKTGTLVVNGLAVNYLTVASGTPAVGKVLVSDANGNAKWASGGRGWVDIGTLVGNTGDFIPACEYRYYLDTTYWGPMSSSDGSGVPDSSFTPLNNSFKYNYAYFAGDNPVAYSHYVSASAITTNAWDGVIGFIPRTNKNRVFRGGISPGLSANQVMHDFDVSSTAWGTVTTRLNNLAYFGESWLKESPDRGQAVMSNLIVTKIEKRCD